MALACPTCEQSAAEYLGMADDGRNMMRCTSCGHEWVLGAKPVSPRAVSQTTRSRSTPARSATSRSTAPRSPSRSTSRPASPARPARERRGPEDVETARRRFPATPELPPARWKLIDELRREFLADFPYPDEEAGRYRDVYRQAFEADALPYTTPNALKDFANSKVVARPGNMSRFNDEWRTLGSQGAAEAFRGVIEHLLRGEDPPAPEDRLTELITSDDPPAMAGFRESMLTRVLCIAEPERFLPILVYTSPSGGKREIARRVFGVELPAPDSTSQTIGRLAYWSNDLLVELIGNRFVDLDHARQFLWWVKDHPDLD
ncbi:hypothetical protein Acsp06_13520 [Actinomycetospora sp. NBRC 106375]|uniref:hypothetical protein n=1 Tax=Actinomycetospora sp. NBRC 106375 TaxID=3032207 RepID=UPI0024A54405|nr:hypothetical protein [Actinomycetospora sp. NBRC 106375]GLZ45167.1 hypothetical protein Acsp06_13520 [Actinomycetospora sp. NBRC 106375]